MKRQRLHFRVKSFRGPRKRYITIRSFFLSAHSVPIISSLLCARSQASSRTRWIFNYPNDKSKAHDEASSIRHLSEVILVRGKLMLDDICGWSPRRAACVALHVSRANNALTTSAEIRAARPAQISPRTRAND